MALIAPLFRLGKSANIIRGRFIIKDLSKKWERGYTADSNSADSFQFN